jgi:hypothetical protein
VRLWLALLLTLSTFLVPTQALRELVDEAGLGCVGVFEAEEEIDGVVLRELATQWSHAPLCDDALVCILEDVVVSVFVFLVVD